ncbi:MAG: type II secretion system GspH family protein [Candidatus Gastranaerophilales bacterium]|nr:type II secretion system GspH family protein [Candidatus Gastranaerophilales bacterium]
MKKGFTLAETLITLAILGVVAAVTMPLLIKSRPDKDAIMYKKAVLTTEQVILTLAESDDTDIADTEKYDSDYDEETQSASRFCQYFKSKVDVNNHQYSGCPNGSYGNPAFQTVDGLQYYGFTSDGTYIYFYVDRNITDKEDKTLSRNKGLSIAINISTGKVIAGLKSNNKLSSSGSYKTYEEKLLKASDGLNRG